MRDFIPSDAKLLPVQATRVFQGEIFDVYQWPQELYDGSTATFEMLKRPDTVKVIPVRDGTFVVQEQEQPQLGFFYDFPGGRHDVEAETELEAAQRETLEETGMRFASWKLLKVEQPYVKIDWLVYTFLATDFVDEQPLSLDAGEKITNTLKTFAEVKDLLNDPSCRYLAKDLLREVDSLEALLQMPDIRFDS